MKVGDYVRYKYENYIYIGKIKFISEVMSGLDETLQLDIDNCMEEILKEDIIKSSPNIIDLIEFGDYVNGGQVREIKKDYIRISGGEYNWQFLEKEEIKSIVTKEMFSSVEYRVEND